MKGCFTALITPFKNGKIDFDSLRNLIEFQIKEGIDGVVPCGTTGESPTLSHEEHREVIRFTHEVVADRIKVIAGSGSNSTKESIELSVFSDQLGIDGLLIVSPYYNKPTQIGIYEHFKTIASNVKSEIIIYNIPGRTSVMIDNETILELSKIKNISTVKEATGQIDNASELINGNPNLDVLSGNDSMNLPFYSVGGVGCISVLSNIFPRETKAIYNFTKSGEVNKARGIHYKFWNLGKTLFLETNPIPIKTACHLKGLISDPEIRLPLTPTSTPIVNELEKLLLEL